MARQFTLPAQASIIKVLAGATDAAGRTSAYVTLKNAHKAYALFSVNQGNAATVQFTVLQAQDVSGTGSKVLTANAPIWADQDTATLDALVVQAAAANFTTSAALKSKVVLMEITPDQCMDMINGFHTIALQTGASNAGNVTDAFIILTPLRYEQQTPPSALSN